ncbi:AAA family ATPase [Massilia sp. CCM 8734]|uniref:AAA family ATPase n=1 Tax=Massilia sp. CCM 8734 TaxID=2609283 RepID=UPI00141FE80F|nr:AAA family ATPase [Massilia sp. CCM 8734]NIA00036.1 AAA family ATPase [Massilia sp. CCM 8734]
MKVALVSPDKTRLTEIGPLLQAGAHVVSATVGGAADLAALAEREQPDLMLVDGCADGAGLAAIAAVTARHPGLAVVLLCAACAPDFLINAMRAGVREVLPAPLAPAELEAALGRSSAKLRGARAHSEGKVLAFIACKGGSGATFLATSMSLQLARTGSVLLVDLNLQFGDALAFVHDGRAPSTLADVARAIARLDSSFLAASTVKVAPNFSLLAAPEDHAQAAEISAAHVDAVLALAVRHYDYVVLDIGRPVTTLSIKAFDRAYRIYPVLQAGLSSIRNAKKMLAIFKSLDYGPDKIELIVNRFERKGEIGVAEVERALGKFAIHTVPNSYKQVTAAIDHGEPLMPGARANPVLRDVAGLAEALSAPAQAALGPRGRSPSGLWARLFGRLPGRSSRHHSGESHVLP